MSFWDLGASDVIGAGGDILGSLFGSDGPEGLSPEAQYELQRLGIDMQTFMAVANVMNQQYQQQMESYGAGAYSDIYGGAESAAGDYAKSAFEGKLGLASRCRGDAADGLKSSHNPCSSPR